MKKEETIEAVLYTTKDIQKIFKTGRDKTYEIIHSNGFPTIRIGREYYVPKHKLERWIEGNIGKEIIIKK